MFYVLRTVDVPFASTQPETFIIGRASTAAEASERAKTLSEALGEPVEITETLTFYHHTTSHGTTVAKAIPPELERAIEAWNSVADRTTPKLPRVRAAANYVAAYRRWKKRAIGRTFLLEELVSKIERVNPDWFQWLNFGWLFGQKDGTLNSDKIMHGSSRLSKPGDKPTFRKAAKKEE